MTEAFGQVREKIAGTHHGTGEQIFSPAHGLRFLSGDRDRKQHDDHQAAGHAARAVHDSTVLMHSLCLFLLIRLQQSSVEQTVNQKRRVMGECKIHLHTGLIPTFAMQRHFFDINTPPGGMRQ
jgi:hypothetical protein